MKRASVLLILLLAGCADTPVLVTEVDTVKVPYPVVTKCVKVEDIPPIPRTHFVKGGNIESNAAAASADVRELQLHAEMMDNLLRACAAQ